MIKMKMIQLERMVNLYENIGYKCIKVSATKDLNIKEIISLIKGKTIMFGGHSGSGKSSIINCINPELNLKIRKYFISASSRKTYYNLCRII